MAVESSLVAGEEGEEEVNDDQISLLPDPILTMILSLIPVIEAARTSVLSKKWRYLWTSIPHLDYFNLFDTFFPIGGFPTQVGEKCISVFYRIFARRQAHINSCDLPIFDDCPVDFYNFFPLLHKLGIQRLLLSHFGTDPKTLSSLFLCNSLEKLSILHFTIGLPSQFNQLTNLQALELTFVRITSTQLEMLVSGCPNLENLTINHCLDLSDLRIHAPNLLLLDIFVEEVERFRFSLIKAPRLKHVVLGYQLDKHDLYDFSEEEDEEDENEIDEVDNLIKLLMNLDHLESFSFRCCPHLFKFKSIMHLPDSLPIGCQLVHLKKLFMELNFDDATMVSPLLFLLRSCPILEQLSLKHECSEIGFPIETNYLEKQRPPKCLTNHLMTIRIENIHLSNKNVIEFVKFLLINAHVLIRMRLLYWKSPRDQSEEDIVVNELLLFEKASQNALLEIKPGGRYEC
ncbi:F-box/LRR-repeat-like protein [Cinnamomum micranthum f. kanehirae]|uniref:F-box/LRR-repeat-like protein n=1 Tax=Cinnamomum micranthum f. kanehirae TaxID=337451 RepID=A0A3S3PA52_9MAGN|nr:F-box/LRR-repeat-like protein [Cinnamomum micranthum f. kanehirae]